MTTRFYFSSTTASAVVPAIDPGWGITTSSVSRKLKTAPALTGGAGSVQLAETSGTLVDRLLGQFVSDGGVLPVGPIAGTFSLVMPMSESSNAADMFQQVRVHVYDSTGTTKRGTIYAGRTETTPSATTSAPNGELTSGPQDTRIMVNVPLVTGTTAQSGDRLVVEHGVRACNASATSFNGSAQYRDDNLTDHALTAGVTTNKLCWIEFDFTAPPGTPTGLTIDPAVTTADLDWSASSGSPTGYEVRLNGGSVTDVGNVLTHTFTGLTGATAYNSPGAEVRAYNAGGFSSWASISFTTDDPAPAAPTGLSVDPDVTTADLDWSASTYATGYEVRLNGGSVTDVGNVLTHTFTGLTGATAYNSPGAEVRAYNATGTSSWASISFTTDAGVPATPTSLDATPTLDTIVLDWVDGGGATPTGYEVRINGGTPTDVGNVLTHTFTGLTPLTSYTLEVRAYNAVGDSSWASIGATTGIPEGYYRVDLVAGPYSWTILHDDPPDYGPLDGLRFGWTRISDQLAPAHPDHSTATFGIVVDEGFDLIELDDDDPVAIRLWLDEETDPALCSWSFYGRVAGVRAKPHRRGMVYTVNAVGYTVDLAELRAGTIEWTTPVVDGPATYLDLIMAEAYRPVLGDYYIGNLVEWPIGAGVDDTMPIGQPPVSPDSAWSLTMTLLRQTLLERVTGEPSTTLPVLLPFATDTGPGEFIGAGIDAGDRYVVDHLDKQHRTAGVPLPGVLVVDGTDVSIVIDIDPELGAIDAGYIHTESTDWTRTKDGRPTNLTVRGVTDALVPVSSTVDRPAPGMVIAEEIEIGNAGVEGIARTLLPDPPVPTGWAAESYRYRLTDNPTGLPMMMHNPADHAGPGQDYRARMYSRPFVVVDIAERHNPTGQDWVAGQLQGCEVFVERGEAFVDFQLSRTLPLPAPVAGDYTPDPRGYLALEDFDTSPTLSGLTIADLDDITIYDLRLVREPDDA